MESAAGGGFGVLSEVDEFGLSTDQQKEKSSTESQHSSTVPPPTGSQLEPQELKSTASDTDGKGDILT